MIIDSAMELALSLEKLTNEKLLLLHSVRLLYSVSGPLVLNLLLKMG